MALPLELGQVSDPVTRRALEQVSVNWPPAFPTVHTLPASGVNGQAAFLTVDMGLYVFYGGTWRKV
jgi:hypothetical protein